MENEFCLESLQTGISFVVLTEGEGFAESTPLPYIRSYNKEFAMHQLVIKYSHLLAPQSIAGYAQAVPCTYSVNFDGKQQSYFVWVGDACGGMLYDHATQTRSDHRVMVKHQHTKKPSVWDKRTLLRKRIGS